MSEEVKNVSLIERVSAPILRSFEQRLSRRSVLRVFERAVLTAFGVMVVPEMPFPRNFSKVEAQTCSCDEWYLCGIYGTLCCYNPNEPEGCSVGCNGGCPSGCGAELTDYWSSCCWNPGDDSYHAIFYYDCCCGGDEDVNCNSCPGCYDGSEEPAWCPDDYVYACTYTIDQGSGTCT
jgi:hypothetical protein